MEISDLAKRRLTTKQAAEYMKIGYSTLMRRRCNDEPIGTGQPRYYRNGRKYYYMPEDLDAYLEAQAVNSIAERYQQ